MNEHDPMKVAIEKLERFNILEQQGDYQDETHIQWCEDGQYVRIADVLAALTAAPKVEEREALIQLCRDQIEANKSHQTMLAWSADETPKRFLAALQPQPQAVDEREAFEHSLKGAPDLRRFELDADGGLNGQYKNTFIQHRWESWQTRAALSAHVEAGQLTDWRGMVNLGGVHSPYKGEEFTTTSQQEGTILHRAEPHTVEAVQQEAKQEQTWLDWLEICDRSAGAVLNGKKGLIILEEDLVRISEMLAASPQADAQSSDGRGK